MGGYQVIALAQDMAPSALPGHPRFRVVAEPVAPWARRIRRAWARSPSTGNLVA